ncbi:MAG: hypothetical protein HQK55_07875, partial [Deltaproteobacteria bacterium]|nr:hypothetical protein [Deltaproteobacteria bacterium]
MVDASALTLRSLDFYLDREIREAGRNFLEGVQLFGYRRNLLELPPYFSDAMDVVTDQGVFDRADAPFFGTKALAFDDGQMLQAQNEIARSLKDGGIHVSVKPFEIRSYPDSIPMRFLCTLYPKSGWSVFQRPDLKTSGLVPTGEFGFVFQKPGENIRSMSDTDLAKVVQAADTKWSAMGGSRLTQPVIAKPTVTSGQAEKPSSEVASSLTDLGTFVTSVVYFQHRGGWMMVGREKLRILFRTVRGREHLLVCGPKARPLVIQDFKKTLLKEQAGEKTCQVTVTLTDDQRNYRQASLKVENRLASLDVQGLSKPVALVLNADHAFKGPNAGVAENLFWAEAGWMSRLRRIGGQSLRILVEGSKKEEFLENARAILGPGQAIVFSDAEALQASVPASLKDGLQYVALTSVDSLNNRVLDLNEGVRVKARSLGVDVSGEGYHRWGAYLRLAFLEGKMDKLEESSSALADFVDCYSSVGNIKIDIRSNISSFVQVLNNKAAVPVLISFALRPIPCSLNEAFRLYRMMQLVATNA